MLATTVKLPQLETVPLQYGTRVFPAELSTHENKNGNRFSKLDQKSARTDSRQSLEGEIWKLLPLATNQPSKTEDAIETYIKSLSVLNQLRTDIDGFLDDVCFANLEFRQGVGTTSEEQRQASIAQKLDEMRGKSRLTIGPPKNQIDAARATLPIELLVPELTNALRDSVSEFVNDFYEGLRALVDKQVCGLIEWPGENVCRYHFFREVLVQHQTAHEESVGPVRFDDDLWIQDVQTKTSGHNVHKFARHEHHVINAYVTSSENTRVVMPPGVTRAVANIPQWLKPVVSIVDGTLIREIVIEQDVSQENWEELHSREEVIPQDDPIYGCEPAVIIDEFVLTGWGPKEIDAELLRRRQLEEDAQADRRQNIAARSRYLFFTGAIATQVTSFWLLLHSVQSPEKLLFSLIVFSATPSLWLMSLQSHLEARQLVPAFMQPGLRVTAWTMIGAAVPFWILGFRFSVFGIVISIVSFLVGLMMTTLPLSQSNSDS